MVNLNTALLQGGVYIKVKKGKLALHSSRPIGLTWKEILDLKKVLNESFPTASRQFYKMKHCNYYDVEKKVYYKRNGKTICEPKTRGH